MQALARPLYQQAREAILHRLSSGEWKAGQNLPSEFALALQLGVSQGTVRKALNELASAHLVERQQGRGTFVPENTEARALFHFFRITRPDGSSVIPGLLKTRIEKAAPDTAAAAALGTGNRQLWRITRVRAIAERPALVEVIHLDPKLFCSLLPETDLPNALYSYYQKSEGVMIASARDFLDAASAPAEVAKQMNIAPGSPLLRATRIACDMREAAVEHRQSWILCDGIGYSVSLR